MNELRSIWDGWKRQCYFVQFADDGATCANGAAAGKRGKLETFRRVAAYIRANWSIPEAFVHPLDGLYRTAPGPMGDCHVIIYANNVLKLTPDDFRRIDIETQIEEAVKPLIESSEQQQPSAAGVLSA